MLHHSSLAVYRFAVAVTVDPPLKPTTHFCLRLPGPSSLAITAGFRFYRLGRDIFCSPVRSRALCGYEVPIADEGRVGEGKKVESRRKQPYIFPEPHLAYSFYLWRNRTIQSAPIHFFARGNPSGAVHITEEFWAPSRPVFRLQNRL